MHSEEELKNLLSKDLLSKLSHHSRSPFNGLLGFSELLLINQHKLSIDDSSEYILRVNMLAKRAFLSSENIIFLLRILSDNVSNIISNIPIKGSIDYAVNICKEGFLLKKITFNNKVDSSVLINADQHLLNSIIGNLLSKAIKLADDGTEVSIFENQEKKYKSINISYIGMAIENETVLHFFNKNNSNQNEFFQPELDIELWIIYNLAILSNFNIEISVSKKNTSTFKLVYPN